MIGEQPRIARLDVLQIDDRVAGEADPKGRPIERAPGVLDVRDDGVESTPDDRAGLLRVCVSGVALDVYRNHCRKVRRTRPVQLNPTLAESPTLNLR